MVSGGQDRTGLAHSGAAHSPNREHARVVVPQVHSTPAGAKTPIFTVYVPGDRFDGTCQVEEKLRVEFALKDWLSQNC